MICSINSKSKEEQLQEVSFVTSSLTVETDLDSYVLRKAERDSDNEGDERRK